MNKNRKKKILNYNDFIVEYMLEKKAQDITIIDFTDNNNFLFSFFIICHGISSPQIEAITNNIQKQLRKNNKLRPLFVEGLNNKKWVLMDYGDVIVHIFIEDVRMFYNLEELWGDMPSIKINTN